MAKQTATITSLPPSLADDQRRRMISYTITMSIRVVCIVLCIIVPGWWALIPAAGAIFLPYFAVVIANAADTRSARVERPGFLLPYTPPTDPPRPGTAP